MREIENKYQADRLKPSFLNYYIKFKQSKQAFQLKAVCQIGIKKQKQRKT